MILKNGGTKEAEIQVVADQKKVNSRFFF